MDQFGIIYYLVLHVMSRGAVHVIIRPLEEVILNDLEVLSGILQIKLGLSKIDR